MKCKCNKCGIEFEDNYKEVNELNKRLWCNKCVKELWEKKQKESKNLNF